MSLLVLNSSNDPKTYPTKTRKSSSIVCKHEELPTETIGGGSLREAVRLPPGEDMNAWMAVHNFYNITHMLYDTLEEFCTPTTCPIMNGGSKYEYKWEDEITITEPIVVSAQGYFKYLIKWIESHIDDETIFPPAPGAPFPPNFEDIVKRIMTRLFRVYAHIYNSHFQKVVDLKEQAHLNTCFKHFVLFISEYQLVAKEELDPLKDLVEEILKP